MGHKETPTLLSFEIEEASSQGTDELELRIRDFAYPESDIRHWGEYAEDSGFVLVRALYDFIAENPSELGFREGDLLHIQYQQCEGWLVGCHEDGVGLVPESYVELVEY
ncbi:hypothetical protein K493DRAFT_313787 [Basidiobolus meristosporus CBS 931.73]|uniref:SH3 domain-containing protein n=1 Tax=Basidiobolus meristosporus CBS 931.73 TaxID=1314790 RepID=A0A1Y1YJG1_9FUNG|nr:hypothetical protein K493DRAFT_313787 [Basidiobolus meristosporus CBS 931.73]|eukprot:ORX98167.1 hypothetical protein K493DRAFT_313787 [Basidiobolus meristosporus CBS 931.73]